VTLGRWAAGAAVALLAALAGPAGADAHIRSAVIASDYRANLRRISGAPPAVVTARLYASDRALRLDVAARHRVSVLAPSGAALLRLDARRGPRRAIWHDPRLRGLPAGQTRAAWRVPLVVDGTPARLEGELWRVRAPAVWPWLALGVPFALALWLARRRLPAAATAFAACAALATVAVAGAFGAAGSAAPGRVVEALDEVALVAAAVPFLMSGPADRRAMAAVAVGFLALIAGCLHLAALGHGVVFAAVPAPVARAAVALGLWAGAAAAVAGALAVPKIGASPRRRARLTPAGTSGTDRPPL
jgi:hypothetical protein